MKCLKILRAYRPGFGSQVFDPVQSRVLPSTPILDRPSSRLISHCKQSRMLRSIQLPCHSADRAKLVTERLSKLESFSSMADAVGFVASRGPITHVIFDMDGLLLDTEKFYTEVQEIILARYNKTFDWSLKAKMMGKKAIEAARVFVEESGISDSLSAEDFLIEREEMLRKLFPTSELMPGASRLIKHLHAKGVPISIATGTHKRHFELKTQKHGELFSLMHHIVLGDDPEVKQGKPAPDGFLTAAKRFEGGPIDPSKVLVFEDAPSGVLAAKNAGMFVVMVPDRRLDSSHHGHADHVLRSLLDFKPEEWGLPPFEISEN